MAQPGHGPAVTRLAAAAAVLVLLALARPASAHPMDVGYLRVDLDGAAAKIELDVDVNLAALLLGADPHALDDAGVHARAKELADLTVRGAPITNDGAACAWSELTTVVRERTVFLSDRADCSSAIRTLRWAIPVVPRAPATFKLLIK